jgi:AI-2 transport protein TqsA
MLGTSEGNSEVSFVSTNRIQTNCLAVLAVIAIGFTLHYLQAVLLPFVLALFFICGISPVLDVLQRWGAPRSAAVVLTFVFGLLLIALFWSMIWISVSSLVKDSEAYRQRVERIANYVTDTLKPYLDDVQPDTLAREDGAPVTQSFPHDDLKQYATARFQSAVQSLSLSSIELLGSGVMIAIFMFFLLSGTSHPKTRGPQWWCEVELQIREYIVLKTLISAATGIAVWVVLWFFGIPLAMVFGLLAFLLNFIPNIGPLVMCVLPLPLIFLDPRLSIASMVVAAIMMWLIQFVSGSVIEPKIMGSSFNLHPVVILLTLLLWGVVWGLPGMFLSTPITAALRIVMDRFAYTRPLARLLAGQLH